MSLESNAKRAVVIYHANCNDGFGAAWAFHKLKEKDYPGGVEYIACQYGQPVHPVTTVGVDLYILDFSFSRDELVKASALYNKITLIDHHKTVQADLENWEDKPENLEIVFDMNRSGAGLTWDYFAEKIENQAHFQGEFIPYNLHAYITRPALINHIEDRDLWKFKLNGTKLIHEVLNTYDKTFDAWTRFANRIENNTGLTDVMREGELLLKQHEQICLSIIDSCKRSIVINGERGLVCNAPGNFASDIGNLLAKESGTFGATYYHDGSDTVKFSLRSIGEYDVSAIAKIFGGGGHRNAAGFELRDPVDSEKGIVLWSSEFESTGIAKTTQESHD